eukprot:788125-Pelagomonas_calceolata.AAC.1
MVNLPAQMCLVCRVVLTAAVAAAAATATRPQKASSYALLLLLYLRGRATAEGVQRQKLSLGSRGVRHVGEGDMRADQALLGEPMVMGCEQGAAACRCERACNVRVCE